MLFSYSFPSKALTLKKYPLNDEHKIIKVQFDRHYRCKYGSNLEADDLQRRYHIRWVVFLLSFDCGPRTAVKHADCLSASGKHAVIYCLERQRLVTEVISNLMWSSCFGCTALETLSSSQMLITRTWRSHPLYQIHFLPFQVNHIMQFFLCIFRLHLKII